MPNLSVQITPTRPLPLIVCQLPSALRAQARDAQKSEAMTSTTHKHNWQFLRQDKRNVGPDRNPEWHIFDVYFCTECLEYSKVHVLTEVPSRESFTNLVMWRKL